MPVGTQGTVKAMTPRDLDDVGATIILGNTYHLYLRPGDELIARRGGLHAFMGWPRPILTDSGGYQVFSLASRRTVEEQGVAFRSHLDGSACALTPESAVDIQVQLGSDIAMVLDECPALPAPADALAASVELTARWAARCARAVPRAIATGRLPASSPTNPGQAQFGIVQGGTSPELRARSAEQTLGDRLRGLCHRRPERRRDRRRDVHDRRDDDAAPAGRSAALSDGRRARRSIWSKRVARGVDMFDCVMPTRNARNGQLFTRDGPLNIKNAQLRRRRSAGRSGLRLLHVPAVFTRLFTPFVPRRRDPRKHP